MSEPGPHGSSQVDFVVGSLADESPDELLDTGTPHRIDRRLLIGVAVTAIVIVGVLGALHSNNTPHPRAAPAASPSSGPFAPVVPTFPTLTAGPQPTPTTVNLGPQLCLPQLKCKHLATPERVRQHIDVAIRRVLGAVRELRIRDSQPLPPIRVGRLLIARKITAHTASGDLIIIAALVGSNDSLSIPIQPGANTSIDSQTADDGFVVGGSLTLSRPGDGLRVFPKLNALLSDRQLVADQ